ncbi:MAG TPA: TolC family protein [Ignavibacteriaceae bacterium]|nr:TolC family protein [Ignavibacteriaceae bacterium]
MVSGKLKLRITILAAILFTANIYSQGKRSLSIDECINIGLKNSNVLHSSKMSMQYANAKSNEADTYRLPTLTFGASYTRLSEVDPFSITTPFGTFDIAPSILNNYNMKLSLQQPIFTGFKLESTSKIAEYNYLAAKEDFSKEEKELVYNIKNSYWGLFKANQLKIVTGENVAQVQAHLTDVQNLFEQGLATKNDVLKVQVQLGEAQLRLIDTKNAVKLANINLDNVLGISLSTDIETTEKVDKQISETEDLSTLLSTAYDKRPELKSIDYRVKASETGITAAKADWWPQLYLTGNYYYSRPNQRIQPAKDEFNGTWDVSLSLSFNLWNWGATGDRTDAAEAQYEQVKDNQKIIKDAITLEVTRNFLDINKSKEKMTVAEQNVNQAEENFRITDEKFKNGLALNSDLLDAEVALLQAKTNYIQSVVDYELAKAQLNKSIGE